ncbi:MAG: hypothetical protein ACYTEP_00310 [Planctomycetota bacterium]
MFSNEAVLDLIPQFLPAADEVWRLQRGGDAECRFFQRAVNGGELITDNGTRQGIYVMAPSGQVLARVNSLDSERVLQMMQEGLDAWRRLPEDRRHLAADADLRGEERWEDSRPKDGLLLERIVRDLPGSDLDSPNADRSPKSNTDTIWFSKSEVDALIQAASSDPKSWHPLPRPFARRLACFAFVDNVYGQCIPFDLEDVKELHLEVRVADHQEHALSLQFRGHTSAIEDGTWRLGDNLWKPKAMHDHALETTMLGHAVYDRAASRLTEFQMIALGRRSGFTALNSRRFRPEPGRIGYLIRMDERAWAAAPTYIALYEADWVKPPKLGRELRQD